MASNAYTYCSQPHPGGDDEARDWCERYHYPTTPRLPDAGSLAEAQEWAQ